MKRRASASQPADFGSLLPRALKCVEQMLDDEHPAIRLAAARIILGRAGGVAAAPGQSSTDAALQAEAELRRRGRP